MFQYEAKIIRIVDGDTLSLDLDLGFHIHVEQVVRLAHINTPETVNYKSTGIDDPAKDFIMQHCPPGSVCVANITRQEKYGRWLAELYFCPGEIDRMKILAASQLLNDELVKAGLAVHYEGGKK